MSAETVRIHASAPVDAGASAVWRVLALSRGPWSSFMVVLGSRCARAKTTLRLRRLPNGIPITVDLLASEPEREIC